MTDVHVLIDQQIKTLETELKNDPRFRQLGAWRALRSEYEALPPPEAQRRLAAAVEPEPVRQKRKYKHKAKPVPKQPRRPKAVQMAEARAVKAKKTAPKKPVASGPNVHDDAVLGAIGALLNRKLTPTAEAIGKVAKIKSIPAVRAAIESLAAAGRITVVGERRGRTYVIHGKVKARSAPEPAEEVDPVAEIEADDNQIDLHDAHEIEEGDGDEPDEEMEVEQEPETQPARSEAHPLPDNFDLASLNRSEREVLQACLAAGDNESAPKIALFADVIEDRVPMILTSLSAKKLTVHAHGKWSLTDLGHSASVAVKAAA